MLPPGFQMGLPGLPGMLPGAAPAQMPAGMDPMALLQMQQAQAQASHMEMVKQAFAEAAARGGPTPTILPPGGLPRPGGHVGPGMMSGIPGMMGMAGMMGMQGIMGGVPGPPAATSVSSAAASSNSSGPGHDGTLEGAAKDFMKRNMLPPSFEEKLVRQLETKGDNWQMELSRLDKELVDAGIPPILRPQFLLVNFGAVVPQTWTDYDEPKAPQQGTAEPRTTGSFQASAMYARNEARRARSPSPERSQRPSRGSGRSRSRRRSRSRDKGKKDRSKERRSRSRQKKSRSRSRKRDK